MRSTRCCPSPRSSPRVWRKACTGFLASWRARECVHSSGFSAGDLGDEPEVLGLGRRQRVAQAEEAEGGGIAEPLRRQDAGRRIGHQAEIDEGNAESALAGRDHHVAMEQYGAADADRVAVDAGEDRLGEGRQRAEHAGHRLDQRGMLGRIEEFGEIAAEAETAGEPAQHHHARLVVIGRGAKRGGEPVIGAAVKQRAAVVGGDGDGQYVVAELCLRDGYPLIGSAASGVIFCDYDS